MAQDKLVQMIAKLTQREAEVLKLRCQGLEWPEVARRLVVSERTVYFHVANIYEKLGLVTLETRRKRDTALRDIFCPVLQQLFREDGFPSRWAQRDDPNPKPPNEDTLALVMYDAMWPAVEAERAVVPWEQAAHHKITEGVKKLLLMPPKKSISLGILLGLLIGLMVSIIGGRVFLSTTSLNLNPAANPASSALIPPASTPIPTAAATRVVAQVVQVVATATPPPTATAIPAPSPTPTQPPTPTPTPYPNTKAGTVLAFGQEWRQDNVSVILTEPLWQDFSSHGFDYPAVFQFRITITNNTDQRLVTAINSGEWSAIDNKGVKHDVITANGGWYNPWTLDSLDPGTVTGLLHLTGGLNDFANSTWLRITIPKLSRVTNAAWQIDVPH